MSAVVDMMVKPLLLMPPFFTFPPVSTVICGTVELIKGGEIENIPGIGQIIKYGRESVLVILLLIVLYVKAWQYIGPKIWHFIENTLKNHTPRPTPPDTDVKEDEGIGWQALDFLTLGVSDDIRQGVDDIKDIVPLVKYYFDLALWYIYHSLRNALLTAFLQIPIDIMSWDMESLSLDFDNLWADKANIFRSGCDRFVNGSYAGDFSLYEDETIASYNNNTYEYENEGGFNDVYYNSKSNPLKYLCTHGNYCSEISDVFGKTLMGMNSSMTDKSPTNGFVNGINISSAPRKYTVCCGSGSVPIVDCNTSCTEANPLDVTDLKNPVRIFDNIIHVIDHPRQFGDEVISDISEYLEEEDQVQIKCKLDEEVYDWWSHACTYHEHIRDDDGFLDTIGHAVEDIGDIIVSTAMPCPDEKGFHKPGRNMVPACTQSWSEIGEHLREAYRIKKEKCIKHCGDNYNNDLEEIGCNADYIEKAKKSIMRNRIESINSTLARDYTEKGIKGRAIKRTKWRSNERLPELNNNIRYTIPGTSGSMTTDNGTLCTRHDLDDYELEECFGPFRPMTPQQYPVLFYKIIKDFMGTILWTLLGIFVFFIILYILCLFNPIGREAYEFNKKAGMVEGGMKSMGIDMKNLNIDKIKNMVK